MAVDGVGKGSKLCHKASYSIQHLVTPYGVYSVLKVQFEDDLTRLEVVQTLGSS